MRTWLCQTGPQASLGQGHLSTGLDPSTPGPTLEVFLNLSWALGASEMNQPPHPYLLPLEFRLGVGVVTRTGFREEVTGILRNEVLRRKKAE